MQNNTVWRLQTASADCCLNTNVGIRHGGFVYLNGANDTSWGSVSHVDRAVQNASAHCGCRKPSILRSHSAEYFFNKRQTKCDSLSVVAESLESFLHSTIHLRTESSSGSQVLLMWTPINYGGSCFTLNSQQQRLLTRNVFGGS